MSSAAGHGSEEQLWTGGRRQGVVTHRGRYRTDRLDAAWLAGGRVCAGWWGWGVLCSRSAQREMLTG